MSSMGGHHAAADVVFIHMYLGPAGHVQTVCWVLQSERHMVGQACSLRGQVHACWARRACAGTALSAGEAICAVVCAS